MDGDDPYDVLQVGRAATVAEIRKSYQNLARKVTTVAARNLYLHVYIRTQTV